LGSPAPAISAATTLGQLLGSFTPDPNGQDVLQYLRGSAAQEVRNGGPFRNRSHTLGDIVNSNPQYVGAPSQGEPAASYTSFAAAYASRPAVLYVGADDGMLHAFDAQTGNERFAYIPTGVYPKLIDLVSPYYDWAHQFYVNGSPQSSDVQFIDGSWHTMLVGTEAQGGASVYALDVTNPAAITTETALAASVLWDFTDVDMGYGFSTPSINMTAAGWQVFVGNGYDSAGERPVLYALNPQTGAITAKIDLCAAVAVSNPTACNSGVANGLSSVAVVNTGGELTAFANLLYAGDLQGNLWRVDISNANPALWAVSILFQARDASNNLQPITTTPVVSLNPRYPQVLGTMVFFATGQLLGTPDLSNQNMQTIYGVYDPPAGYAAPLTRSSLVQQMLTAVQQGASTLDVVTGNAVAIPTQKGWYIDLSLNAGERVVTDPTLQAGELILTSYIPNEIACTGGGSSNFYVINYATGSSFPSPQFDVNGDGVINSGDTVNSGGASQNPVGMSLGNVFAAAPTVLSTAGGSMALTTLSNGTILTTKLAGQTLSRQGWWEIR
jgi:type IV pilus assembly protein PilY1